MKRALLCLLAVFAVASLLVAARWHVTQRDFAGFSLPQKKYDIARYHAMRAIDHIASPSLPDIPRDGVERARLALPALRPGAVTLSPLSDVYRKAIKELPAYQAIQETSQPQAIYIADGVYDLPALTAAVGDSAALQGAGSDYRLSVPLIIGERAVLRIDNHATLRLLQNRRVFIANFGGLHIVDATIEGWNGARDGPASFTTESDFRPYLVSWCGSHMTLAGSRFADLGFMDSKSYGITYTSCRDTVFETLADAAKGAGGVVVGNIFERLYFGFYSYESPGLQIIDNRYVDNIVYGIDPHDRSHNLIIVRNHVSGSRQKHGIILSRDVNDSIILENISEDNAGTGLMIDRNSRGNIITGNILRRNGGDGLAFYESPDNFSWQNILAHNRHFGLRLRNSAGIISSRDVMNYNDEGGATLYTADLQARGHKRDAEKDPYRMSVTATLSDVEMTGNRQAQIVTKNIDRLLLARIRSYEAPALFLGGDLRRSGLEEGDALHKAWLVTRKESKPVKNAAAVP